MPDPTQVGHQLRGLRAAAGRTVASVAADAGLSVPYIANLENGRGNPTIAALDRLATALGVSLDVGLQPAAGPAAPALMPASLVRLGRSQRFQRDASALARHYSVDAAEYSPRLMAALAAIAAVLPDDPGEAGWARLLDALLLIAAFPAVPD